MEQENNTMQQAPVADPNVVVVPSDPGMVTMAPADTKKKKKKGGAFGWILILLAAAGAAVYFLFFFYTPAIEIDGKKITLKTTVSEVLDMGYVFIDSTNKVVDMSGTLQRKAVESWSYQIAVPNSGGTTGDGTGIYVRLINPDSAGKSRKNCSFYSIKYYPEQTKASVTITIGGKNLKGTKKEEVVAAIKETKIPIKEKELQEIADGKSTIALGSNQSYRYEVGLDTVNNGLMIQFERTVTISTGK